MEKHLVQKKATGLSLSLVFMCFVFVLLSLVSALTDQISSCLTLHSVHNFTTFPDTSSTPDDDYSYSYYNMLNFSIQNLRFVAPSIPKPIAIILPHNVAQVTSAVLCSRKASYKIIVRSGGHSYEGTSSIATPPFVIIDMMNLKQITLNLESKTAWVEAGATLGETYYAIAKASNVHAFSAGSCPTVGVGGHIAGGGFGLLSRKYGLAADNVVDALLVDANGQLLDRNGMGEDVFWAIRGGGGGVWGIVYAWKIQLLKVPPTVTTFVVSRPSTSDQVAKLVYKWQHVAPNLRDDFYLSCFVGAGLPEATSTIGISATFKGFYLGSKADTLSHLAWAFPELGVVEDDCAEMSWIESIVFFSGLPPESSALELQNRYLRDKKYFKAKSDYVRTPISYAGIRVAIDLLEKQPKGYVIFDPYGGIMDRISSYSIAFPHRKGNLYSIQYMVEWQQQDDEKRNDYINWIRQLYNSMAPYVSWGPRVAYVNYIDFDLGVMLNSTIDDFVEIARVWGEKYFLDNFDRLVRAKTLIDPHNVFSNQQGIPPMTLVSLRAQEVEASSYL